MSEVEQNLEQELQQLKLASLDYMEATAEEINSLQNTINSLNTELSNTKVKLASLEAERLVTLKKASDVKTFLSDDEARDLLNVLTSNGFIKKSNINANINSLKSDPRSFYGLMLKMAETISANNSTKVEEQLEPAGYVYSQSKIASSNSGESKYTTQADVARENRAREEKFLASMQSKSYPAFLEDPFKTYINQF